MVEFVNVKVRDNYIYAHAKDYDFNYEAGIRFSISDYRDFSPKNASPGVRRAVLSLRRRLRETGFLKPREVVAWG